MSEEAETVGHPFDPWSLPGRKGTSYPAEFAREIRDREKRTLGNAAGLTRFGVNLTRLPPGEISSQRHWHSAQDEFVYLLSGELVLQTDEGETIMQAGQCIGFPAGRGNGHRFVNRSTADAVYLEVGDRTPDDHVTYPDVDLAGHSADGRRYAFGKKQPA
jgi:uncharacterized cupin superfamily protein